MFTTVSETVTEVVHDISIEAIPKDVLSIFLGDRTVLLINSELGSSVENAALTWFNGLSQQYQYDALDNMLDVIPGQEWNGYGSWTKLGHSLQSCKHLDNDRLYLLYLKYSMRDPRWGGKQE